MNNDRFFFNDPTAATSVPNRCEVNKHQSRCKEAVTRNLNGTWATKCEKHKAKANKANETRYKSKAVVLCSTDEDAPDANNVAPICELCDGETRPNKNRGGYTKYCDGCREEASEMYKAIIQMKRARRAMENIENSENLRAKKQKLEEDLLLVNMAIETVEEAITTNTLSVEQARETLEKFL